MIAPCTKFWAISKFYLEALSIQISYFIHTISGLCIQFHHQKTDYPITSSSVKESFIKPSKRWEESVVGGKNCHVSNISLPHRHLCSKHTWLVQLSGFESVCLGNWFSVISFSAVLSLQRILSLKSAYIFKGFTETQFTHHTIHPVKVYNSVVFSIFTDIFNHHHNQF